MARMRPPPVDYSHCQTPPQRCCPMPLLLLLLLPLPLLLRLLAAVYNEAAFCSAFSVIVATAAFLPAANCFALLPLVSGAMARTGNGNGCDLDFDPELNAVVVTAVRPYRCGPGRRGIAGGGLRGQSVWWRGAVGWRQVCGVYGSGHGGVGDVDLTTSKEGVAKDAHGA